MVKRQQDHAPPPMIRIVLRAVNRQGRVKSDSEVGECLRWAGHHRHASGTPHRMPIKLSALCAVPDEFAILVRLGQPVVP